MNKNPSIKCDVKSCKFNCETEDYCSLDSVNIGTHEPHPTVCECVDCKSFVKKSCC